MENEKRILLAIVLSIIVLYLYQAFLIPPASVPEQKHAPEQQPPVQQQKAPSAPVPPVPAVKGLNIKPPPAVAQTDMQDVAPSGKEVTVTTDLFTATFLEHDAGLSSFKLHKYKDTIAPPAVMRFIKGMFSAKNARPDDRQTYGAFKELIHLKQHSPLPLRTLFVTVDNTVTGDAGWRADRDTLLIDGTGSSGSVVFTDARQQNITMEKAFSFTEDQYKVDFTVTLRNSAETALTGGPVIEWVTPLPENSGGGFFSGGAPNISDFVYFINGKVEKKELAKIKEPVTLEGDMQWTAIEEKYFMSAIVFRDQKPGQVRLAPAGEELVSYQLLFPAISLKPGEEQHYSFSLYLGPKDIDILQRQGASLEKAVVFGWFDVIAKPLLVTLTFFNGYFHNYGLAIILVTIIIKILFWPLTHKSFESMKSMQLIQPEVNQLKEKYKDNKEEFARQQLALYKKYKVNPLSGCLPTLIQIPVFIALYNALMYSIELRHAPFISFWINDLSEKDPTYIAPVIMGASMLLQQKMTPTSADPAQAKMMMFMPIVFTVMFLSFPSGLVIYWLINNVISIAQQLYINKKLSTSGGKACSPSKLKQNPSKKRSQ